MARGNSDTFDPRVSDFIFHVRMYIKIVGVLESKFGTIILISFIYRHYTITD